MKRSLVLSGGSTKIPLHVGALMAIDEKKIIFDSIYANSAGSIIGSLLASNYTVNQIYYIILKTDFSKLAYQSLPDKLINIFSGISLVPGDRLLSFFYEIFGPRTLSDVVVDLNLMTHSLDDRSYVILNKANFPTLSLALAVRASVSMPLFFDPIKIGDKYFIDGGISKDFPVDLVPSDQEFIGHLIQNTNDKNAWINKNIIQFGLSLIGQFIQSNVEESIRDCKAKGIIIKSEYNLSMTKFSIDNFEKIAMINLGYDNTKTALA